MNHSMQAEINLARIYCFKWGFIRFTNKINETYFRESNVPWNGLEPSSVWCALSLFLDFIEMQRNSISNDEIRVVNICTIHNPIQIIRNRVKHVHCACACSLVGIVHAN